MNITIAGAGITGLCVARGCVQAGHTVSIFDAAGFPAMNSSYIAGGMLAPYSEIDHMNDQWAQAGLESIEIWRDIANKADIGFHANGSCLVAHGDDKHILKRFARHLPHDSYTTQTLPDHMAHLGIGLFLKDEAHLNPETTIRVLCDMMRDYYVAEDIDPAGYLKTHQDCDVVIDCRGMGSVNDEPDLRAVKGETLLVCNTEFTLDYPVRFMHPRYPLYIVPRGDGVFMIGATVVETDDVDDKNNHHVMLRSAMELMSALYALHPSFGDAEILDMRSGLRPSYPDNLPRVTIKDKVISCNGMFRHGYLFAPIMADIVLAELDGTSHIYRDLFIKDQQ